MTDFFNLLFKSIVIGFSIAAPVGPIGVLCIRRTLAKSRTSGLVSGLGAATADAVYGFIAAFGLTLISDILINQKDLLGLIGGAFLFYLGVKTLLVKPAQDAAVVREQRTGLAGDYVSTFFLTLANPLTILSFLGIFAGIGIVDTSGDYTAAGVMVAGVFGGSALWWLTLSGGVGLLRDRFNSQVMLWVNRLSGVVILIFALHILVSLNT